MKRINFNKELIKNNYNNQKIKFEVNPLDVSLAEIQFNLLKRLEREMPEYGDFAPVIEKYESKDPTKNISTVRILMIIPSHIWNCTIQACRSERTA